MLVVTNYTKKYASTIFQSLVHLKTLYTFRLALDPIDLDPLDTL